MPEEICTVVGQNIRRLRRQNGWTQTYLSIHAGVGRNYISDVERGRKEMGLRNLHLLARSLGVPVLELLKGVD